MPRKPAPLSDDDLEAFDSAEAEAKLMCSRTREAVALLDACGALVKAGKSLAVAYEQREFRGPEPLATVAGNSPVAAAALASIEESANTVPEPLRSSILAGTARSRTAIQNRPDCAAVAEAGVVGSALHQMLVAEVFALSVLGLPWPQDPQDEVLVNLLADRGWTDTDIARAFCFFEKPDSPDADYYDSRRIWAGRARKRRSKRTRDLSVAPEELEKMRQKMVELEPTAEPRTAEQILWWLTSAVQFQIAAITGKPELVRVPWTAPGMATKPG